MHTVGTLSPPTAPFDIEVVKGFTVTVEPLTAFSMLVAKAHAQRIVDDIRKGIATIEEAGIATPDFDADNEDQMEALYRDLLIKKIAVDHIKAWNVTNADTGEVMAPDEASIKLVFSDFLLSESFYAKIGEWHMRRLLAKKGSGTAAHGTPQPVPNTAPDAKTPERPAQKG